MNNCGCQNATLVIQNRCVILKPAAQTAHLFFTDTKANA
jgi:hypothetical protein